MKQKINTPQNLPWHQETIILSQASLDLLLRRLEHVVFYDSSSTPNRGFISGNPIEVYQLPNKTDLDVTSLTDTPYPESFQDVPFCLGYAGFVSYEAGNEFVNKQQRSQASCPTATYHNSFIGLFTWSLTLLPKPELPKPELPNLELPSPDIEDTQYRSILTFSPLCDSQQRNKVLNLLNGNDHKSVTAPVNTETYNKITWKASTSPHSFKTKIETVKNHLAKGDCYQVNLTQRFEAKTTESPAGLYQYLRRQTQTPFSCYISTPSNFSILSFSPERFLKIESRTVTTKPIKGTIENNGSQFNAETLKNSEKDKAENLMIVDLLRNDLSKVSKLNSVKVSKLFNLETFKNVHHLVSEINSELNDDISEFNAFLSCFPGGSITGAPKIKAMEIIRDLEDHSRQAYCGSAFFWNYNRYFDSNILIRTIVQHGDSLYCWGGGGITIESDAEEEYAESLLKVSNLTGIQP